MQLKTPIALVGMGISGHSALRFLLARGFNRKDLITFDEKALDTDVNSVEQLLKMNPQTLVVSPGVHLQKDWIKKCRNDGVFITSEISLATSVLKGEKILGVTGSVGKSTTTALIGEVLRRQDPDAFIGGNFGVPFCDYAESVLRGTRPRAKWVVLELSSYQLENSAGLELNGAAITSLSPNHLERYSSLEDYFETKLKITSMNRGPLILNRRSDELWKLHKDPRLSQSETTWAEPQLASLKNLNLSTALLIGDHNQENLAVAALLLLHFFPLEKIQKPLLDFSGLPHRLERVGEWNQILVINDSKATALSSVVMALRAVQSKVSVSQRIHLLLGGRDKNLPWKDLKNHDEFKSQVELYFFGEARELIARETDFPGSQWKTLFEATEKALDGARPGDLVLLSPGGTSLDEFKNFEARGEAFKKWTRDFFDQRK